MEMTRVFYRAASWNEFVDAIANAKAMRGDQGLCVSLPDDEADLFISMDGLSGYALTGNNLGSVFSSAKGRLAGMIQNARARARLDGQRVMRLDCFAPLAKVYARHGFLTTGSTDFDWQYAPKGWASKHGEPDVVFMSMPLSEVPMYA